MERADMPREAERSEASDAASLESQRLTDATFEPEAVVEQTSDFQQAEAIEAAFVQAVEETARAGERDEARLPLPAAGDSLGEEGRIAVAPAPAAKGEELSDIPLPIPLPAFDGGASSVELREVTQSPGGREQVETMPIPIPHPESGGEGVSATPITLPDAARLAGGDEISATPITLPDAARLAGGDEISATPIPLPGPELGLGEVSATPITLPKEAPDRVGDVVSATPIPLPGPELGVDEVSATPIPLPGPELGVDEVSATPIPLPGPELGVDKVSATPIPLPGEAGPRDQRARPIGGGEQVSATPITLPDEVGPVGREQVSATPITLPKEASERAGDVASAVRWPDPDSAADVLSATPITLPKEAPEAAPDQAPETPVTPSAPESEGAETPFSTELAASDEGPVETLATGAEQSPEVKEYWEPPELYLYRGADGSIAIVDEKGNPIDSPPTIKSVPVGEKGVAYYGWYFGSDQSQVFQLKEYNPPTSGIYAYTDQDGAIRLVDWDGHDVKCPPAIFGGGEDGKTPFAMGPDGTPIEIPAFVSGDKVFAYQAQDGSIRLVDKNGHDVPCPPHVIGGGEDGKTLFTVGPDGKQIEIPAYQPSSNGVYAYHAQDGSVRLVDEKGQDVPCPPHIIGGGEDGKTLFTVGPDGKQIEIPAYQPSLDGVYAYRAQDGSVRLVDENGQDVPCPPPTFGGGEDGKTPLAVGPDGKQIAIPIYQPSLDGVYAHTGPDGSVTLVDKSGGLVYSPPWYSRDPSDGKIYTVGPRGEKVEIPPFKPPSAHWGK